MASDFLIAATRAAERIELEDGKCMSEAQRNWFFRGYLRCLSDNLKLDQTNLMKKMEKLLESNPEAKL